MKTKLEGILRVESDPVSIAPLVVIAISPSCTRKMRIRVRPVALSLALVQRQVDEWEGRTKGMSKKKVVESNCESEKGITRKFALQVSCVSRNTFFSP